MKLTVHGSGYVGLVSAACLASVGNDVMCVDIDSDRVVRLRNGDLPIREPGLAEIVKSAIAAGRLAFTAEPADGVAHAGLQFIAVGTPPDEDGSADLRHVLAVADSIGQHMDGPRLVAVKSTVPVGTAEAVGKAISARLEARGVDFDVDVVSNPEFLKEGAAVEDFMKPDRVIIGAGNQESIRLLASLYKPFTRQQERLQVMPVRDAEFTKYAANTMLATRISLMNEFANLAERLGVDIESVRRGIGSDPRIGPAFLYPGCGYGGSCFPKDVDALLRMSESAGYTPELLAATRSVNERQKRRLFEKLEQAFEGNLRGRCIAVWGLAFKAGTDDIRAASSRVLVEALWEAGATVRAYDPAAMAEWGRVYGERDDMMLCAQRDEALDGADAVVVCTEWLEFRSPDIDALRSRLKRPLLIDGRNLYDPAFMREQGIEYYGIGRGIARD